MINKRTNCYKTYSRFGSLSRTWHWLHPRNSSHHSLLDRTTRDKGFHCETHRQVRPNTQVPSTRLKRFLVLTFTFVYPVGSRRSARGEERQPGSAVHTWMTPGELVPLSGPGALLCVGWLERRWWRRRRRRPMA